MTKNIVSKKLYIYELDGIEKTNKGQLKGAGYSFSKNYQDGELLIDGKTNIKEIMNNIYVKMYKSMMTWEFLSTNRKVPYIYGSIYYQRKFVTGHLLSVTVYFDILSDTKKIASISELLEMELDGKYYLEIEIGETKKIIDIDGIGGVDEVRDQIMMIIESDAMKKIIQSEMNKRDQERVEKYGKMVSDMPREPKYKFNDLLEIYEKDGNMDRIEKIV